MSVDTEKFELSDAVKTEIQRWLKKYPVENKRSVIVPALIFTQKQNAGWLSPAAMKAVSEYLQLPEIMIYEVATFYDMYNLKPVGKHQINVCENVSCYLMGSNKIVECLENRLGIKMGETTPDGLFTLKRVECLAACGGAPMCQINNEQYHENLTPEKILKIVDQLEQEVKLNAH